MVFVQMKKINPPQNSVLDTISACANDLLLADQTLSQILDKQNVKKVLSAAEHVYTNKAKQGRLFTLRSNHKNVANCLSINDMKKAYKTMSSCGKKGKQIYDKIKNADDSQICPFCNHRNIVYIDHFLPKSKYPHYSITPINLVPICHECNSKSKKGALYPTSAETQFIHPYFDDFSDAIWLYAVINNTFPFTMYYSPYKPASWDDVKYQRIKYHFDKLKLNELYTSNAVRELFNRKITIQKRFEASGADGLKAYFYTEGVERRASEKNSWQAALYEALGQSDFFCHNVVDLIS